MESNYRDGPTGHKKEFVNQLLSTLISGGYCHKRVSNYYSI